MTRAAAWVPLVLALSACSGSGVGSGGGAGTAASPLASPTTAADCAAVIPTDVVRGLGWTTTAAPTYDLGTCTLTGDEGTLTVQRQPADDYDARCGALRPDGGPATAVDWLGDDVPACAAVSGDGTGVNVLLAQARADLVVELRVLTTAPSTARPGAPGAGGTRGGRRGPAVGARLSGLSPRRRRTARASTPARRAPAAPRGCGAGRRRRGGRARRRSPRRCGSGPRRAGWRTAAAWATGTTRRRSRNDCSSTAPW